MSKESQRARAEATLASVRWPESGPLTLNRRGITLVFQKPPEYVTDNEGNIVGVDAWVRAYRAGNEIDIDPHRRFVNPPAQIIDEVRSTKQTKIYTVDPMAAFEEILFNSIERFPNPGGKGTVTTIFNDSTGLDGHISSIHATYSTARSGSGSTLNATSSGTTMFVGQRHQTVGGGYQVFEGFMSFDTAVIPDGDNVTAATIILVLDDNRLDDTNESFTLRTRSWRAGGLTTADFVAGASISGSGTSVAVTVMETTNPNGTVEDFGGGANLIANINKTGYLELIMYTGNIVNGTAPPTDTDRLIEWRNDYTGTTSDPILVVTHDPPFVNDSENLGINIVETEPSIINLDIDNNAINITEVESVVDISPKADSDSFGIKVTEVDDQGIAFFWTDNDTYNAKVTEAAETILFAINDIDTYNAKITDPEIIAGTTSDGDNYGINISDFDEKNDLFEFRDTSFKSIVTLTNDESISVELDVMIQWNAPFSREFGHASFRIPRNSPAFDNRYVDENGGFLVQINHYRLGRWTGIAQVPTINQEGAFIEATEIGILTTIRTVNVSRIFTGVTAGAIIRAGLNDSLAGLSSAYIKPGTFIEAGPHIPQYVFSGQYFSDVIRDMMEFTGQEYELTEDCTFNWIAPKTNMYQHQIVEGSDFIDVSRSGDMNEVIAEAVAIGEQGYSAHAFGPGQGLWQKQEQIAVDTRSHIELSIQAKQLAELKDEPLTRYEGLLRHTSLDRLRDHWSNIREGDTLRLVLPTAGINGNCPTVRVLSRQYDPNEEYLRVVLQYPAYVDRSNAARIIQRNIEIKEAPSIGQLNNPCLYETVNLRTTTVQSTSSASVVADDGSVSSTITVNITPVTDPCHSFYYVRYKPTTLSIYAYIPTYGTQIDIPGLVPGLTYHVGVATVGKSGVISAYSADSSRAAAGDSTVPGQVTGATVTPGINALTISWSALAIADLSHYEIHRSPQGSNSSWSLWQTVKGTYYRDVFTGTSSVSYSYKIRAVDLSGNVGALSASTGLGATQKVETGIGAGDIDGSSGGQINVVSPAIFSAGIFVNTLTIGAGGKIIDSQGSFWDSSGIVLVSAGSFGDSITWKVSGSNKASIYASSTQAKFQFINGCMVNLEADTSGAFLMTSAGLSGPFLMVRTGAIVFSGLSQSITIDAAGMEFDTPTPRIVGSASVAGIRWDNIANGGSAGVMPASTPYFNLATSSAGAGAVWRSGGWIKINIAGTNYRVPIFADV